MTVFVSTATATVHVAQPQAMGPAAAIAATATVISSADNARVTIEDLPDDDVQKSDEVTDNFWHTSVGKFNFSLDTLPQPLQYIYQLLTELPTIEKPDILYYMLQCLNVLTLHGDALAKAARDQRGFFIWCQENLLIKK